MREWLRNQAAGGYVAYDAGARHLRTAARAGAGARRRGEPLLPPRRLRADRLPLRRRGQDHRRLPSRARAWAGTSTTTASSRAPSASSAPATKATWWPSGSRRSTASRRSCAEGAKVADIGCGHGASTDPHGGSLPELGVPRLRLPPRLDRAGPRGRRRRRHRQRPTSRSRRAKDYPGTDYDLVAVFDCLHDMGDPVGASTHIHDTLAARRHLDDRRALRRRPRRGQPQPGRPRLLRRLDDDLHPGVAGPGGRPGARRPGRREAPRRGDRRGRLLGRSGGRRRRRST